MGKQDVVFAGGTEELDWSLSNMFDAMGAMSSNFNDRPAVASRAYDLNRDGFVIAGGAGIVVLEEWSGPRPAARRSTPRSSATRPIRTASTWSPPRARAPPAA
jgi:3-oxoacyl-[acyl-carrier-protein] synthase-1